MASYISQLKVSLDEADEQQFANQGFTKVNAELNQRAGGKNIYIWFKRGSEPITKLQITFNKEMAVGLINAGYTKIPKDLNDEAGGDCLYLWYFKGSGEYNTPIEAIDVTTNADDEAMKFKNGWERLTCDLNRKAGGNWIHLWVKREKKTYICDVTATVCYETDSDHYKKGFIRLDEDTNRGAGGSFVFIWYRQTPDSQRALSELNVSTDSSEYQSFHAQKYTPVSVNLNKGTGGNRVNLWYKKDHVKHPVTAITLLLGESNIKAYKVTGVPVIERDLNKGNRGTMENVCFYQWQA
ncbi:uncharacterized protein LOC141756320 [Sebastes fasciatus]|uniref:uncharacterized protein LOC141756320 n=1 Tax=Sebastes fasciatus TaxID=394691 RepID=UPI003D9E7AF3